nr:MAG TPA: hypothetical protein [Caudoviricetes sp.]
MQTSLIVFSSTIKKSTSSESQRIHDASKSNKSLTIISNPHFL